jgi:regulator of sigma E protease
MTDTLRSVLAFIVDIGVLVFFHELGHYLAARSQGVVVEAFSIGFGPALVSWRSKKTGTVWKLSALPLGGYVKMQGWGEESEPGAPVTPGSFAAASLPSRALIVAAGPVANLLLAYVVFVGLFLAIGQVVVQPVLSSIVPGSPAALAGLQTGDRVLSVDGTRIVDFSGLQSIILAHPDATLDFSVNRHGAVLNQSVKLGDVLEDGEKIGHLGVAGTQASLRHFSLPGALKASWVECWNDTVGTLSGLYNLAVHHQGLSGLTGPLGIAQISGQAASLGIASVIGLIALLSINLGLVNLIPIPVLDGGHLLFYLAEALYGRPIPPRAQEIGLRFGVAIILSLFFVTTFNDLTRLGAVNWVTHLLG